MIRPSPRDAGSSGGAEPADERRLRMPEQADPEPDVVVDLRTGAAAPTRRLIIGGCLVDVGHREPVLRILRGHLNRPPGTGIVLVASANLDHVTNFGGGSAGDQLDPGRMDDWLVLLDGQPMVLAARMLTGVRYPRLAGADLLPALLSFAEADHRRVAFLGGHPSVRAPLVAALRERWPQLLVVGHWTPERSALLDPDTSRQLAESIAKSEPSLVVVGLGKPLQERWLARHGRETGAPLAVAFGAAIDFTAGTVRRAPVWLQTSGLEWSYRLVREPRRMSRRYLLQGPPAMRRVLLSRRAVPQPFLRAAAGPPSLTPRATSSRASGR
jgi:N-acetylglucosaminyldiphosphoundecaprenol N-acetyl-beta-D-mannosaminyltransferase